MPHVISDKCVACGACKPECPVDCITEGDIYRSTRVPALTAGPVLLYVLLTLSARNKFIFPNLKPFFNGFFYCKIFY